MPQSTQGPHSLAGHRASSQKYSNKSPVLRLELEISIVITPTVSITLSSLRLSRTLRLTNFAIACNTNVTVELSFGGSRSWKIDPVDFQLTRLTRDTCLGAFFEITSGSSAPSWIVGDTFLVSPDHTIERLKGTMTHSRLRQKNVYSVFRYSPPSIGFAELSSVALALNGADGPVPSATIGSSAATVSATGGITNSHGHGSKSSDEIRLGRSIVLTSFVLLATTVLGTLLL